MVFKYVVSLKNLQNRYIDLVGLFLSVFSIVCYAREMLNNVYYIIAVAVIAGFVIYNLIQAARKKKVFYSRTLLLAALFWMKMPYWQWLAFVFIVLAFLEYQAKYEVEVGFGDDRVVINTLFKRKYRWDQFNNVILKDGILTLDFSNNRILQREIEDDEDEDDASEEEFNDYCRSRLAALAR